MQYLSHFCIVTKVKHKYYRYKRDPKEQNKKKISICQQLHLIKTI